MRMSSDTTALPPEVLPPAATMVHPTSPALTTFWGGGQAANVVSVSPAAVSDPGDTTTVPPGVKLAGTVMGAVRVTELPPMPALPTELGRSASEMLSAPGEITPPSGSARSIRPAPMPDPGMGMLQLTGLMTVEPATALVV